MTRNEQDTSSEITSEVAAEQLEEATSEPAQKQTVQELTEALTRAEEELARKQTEASEYLDNWRRTAAELSNARKRMLREREELRAMASERVLEKLLPIVDDMDRAFAALPPDQGDSDWVNGFRAIQRKLHSLLESEGVIEISTTGRMFDPAVHFAVTHEEAEGYDEGQIIGEAARGYKLGDKVLRPSMVRVAKGNQKQQEI